jgi:hypothetical protein
MCSVGDFVKSAAAAYMRLPDTTRCPDLYAYAASRS